MTHCGVPPDSFVADLHIHSKYSRACSRDLDLDNITWWARRKGITLLGTVSATLASWLVETVAAEKEQAEDLQAMVRRLEAKVDQLAGDQERNQGPS